VTSPSNRRVGKPQLPPDVLAEVDFSQLEAEPAVSEPPPAKGPSGTLVRIIAVARVVLGAALVLSVAVSVAWGARRYVRESPRFALHDVVVTGMKHRTEQEIVERAGLVIGQNVFAIELAEARARLAGDPWLRDVKLARRLPGTIAIEVSEREAAAMVVVGETTYLATRDGEIFKRF
jgi:cell division protein FtsQ